MNQVAPQKKRMNPSSNQSIILVEPPPPVSRKMIQTRSGEESERLVILWNQFVAEEYVALLRIVYHKNLLPSQNKTKSCQYCIVKTTSTPTFSVHYGLAKHAPSSTITLCVGSVLYLTVNKRGRFQGNIK
jgi:hypothetical protein